MTHSLIYNNTVLIGPGHKEAIVEVRPLGESKPRYADGAMFLNNVVIVAGEALYDLAEAKDMRFDSSCIIGSAGPLVLETRAAAIQGDVLPNIRAATSWKELTAYKAAAEVCGLSPHNEPENADRDLAGGRDFVT